MEQAEGPFDCNRGLSHFHGSPRAGLAPKAVQNGKEKDGIYIPEPASHCSALGCLVGWKGDLKRVFLGPKVIPSKEYQQQLILPAAGMGMCSWRGDQGGVPEYQLTLVHDDSVAMNPPSFGQYSSNTPIKITETTGRHMVSLAPLPPPSLRKTTSRALPCLVQEKRKIDHDYHKQTWEEMFLHLALALIFVFPEYFQFILLQFLFIC